ncbi:hypothetical protein BJ875DRAFT_429425 [Amylocarpus encephaloides]|uniref:NAD(P)-binding protein n=1 Tax=Amylocarpus encephaloides TaxID=45428 RepID=A0A9P7YEB7_9HELO|nr:hypothetical protein BJ875DRAFT_429425 [Amylocarpus encephaloides]
MATSWGEMFPPSPGFTEKDISSQHGRVFLITGGTTGIGFELAKALYHLNGRVYITSRSLRSAEAAITRITSSRPHPSQKIAAGSGSLQPLKLDFSDLRTIKATAKEFLLKETRLDVLWHNAGLMIPDDPKATTAQGYHEQLGINALGPFLLQHFLTPLILATAAFPSTPAFSTRVIFVSSSGHRAAPKPDGVNWSDINLSSTTKAELSATIERYGQSKAMNVMHAHELARKYHSKGVMSLSLHPGSLSTGLQKNAPRIFNAIFSMFRYEPRFGALTGLWAGLVPVSPEEGNMGGNGKYGRNGGYVLPWGRWGEGSKDVFQGLRNRGTGERLWILCEELVRDFM